ncbi:dienelactone hydrolase family protein [Dehalococcoidia bacterium]|nr:dienelactone hydrolase family protein [Dehalococcoidia bacterium]
MRVSILIILLSLFFVSGCGSTYDNTPDDSKTQGATLPQSSIPNNPVPTIEVTKVFPNQLTENLSLTITQEVDGRLIERPVLVEAPSNLDLNKTYPLLFLFHGNGGNIDGLSRHNQADTSAEAICRGNCIGVIPQGQFDSWNLAGKGVNDELESNADDVEFVEAIIKRLSKYPQVDSSRVFGIGYSNGAGMVQVLAAESQLFQGIAAFATNLIKGREPKNKDHKVLIIQFHGMEDMVIPYGGGESIVGRTFIGAEESAQIWATHNECNSKPSVEMSSNGDKRIEYFDCVKGAKVFHIGVRDGTHDVAGPNKEYLDIAWGLFDNLPIPAPIPSPATPSAAPIPTPVPTQVRAKPIQTMTAKEKLLGIDFNVPSTILKYL